MKQHRKHATRRQAGEEVVSVLVKQALLAGATIEQLERQTGCHRHEIERLLEQLERIEQMLRAESKPRGRD